MNRYLNRIKIINCCIKVILLMLVFSCRTVIGQTCSSPLPLTIGANDATCNSQSFSSLNATDFDAETPAITTVTNTCGVTKDHNPRWYSFTGDGSTIRFKIYGQDQASQLLVFDNMTCGASISASQCATFPDDNLPHIIDINTISGHVYKIAVVKQSGNSTMLGNVCAYKTNGNPYSPVCDQVTVNTSGSLPNPVNISISTSACGSSVTATSLNNGKPSGVTPIGCGGIANDDEEWWGTFTGNGQELIVKLSGASQDDAVLMVYSGTCGSSMNLVSCHTNSPVSNMSQAVTIVTTNGTQYWVRLQRSNGTICVYPNPQPGKPYSPLCDATPVALTVKTKNVDCFAAGNYANANTNKVTPAPPTPCAPSATFDEWWIGTFTAIDTKTELYLWGKDETNASIEVLEGPCSGAMTSVFCNNNTGAKDQPNWGSMNTVIGKQYYVIVKSVGLMDYGRLCIYSQPPEPTKPYCTTPMSFEDGVGAGWVLQSGAYHLVSAPGTTWTYTYPTVGTAPSAKFAVTTGTGVDPIVGGMIPVVAPGGGNYSFRLGDNVGAGYTLAVPGQTGTNQSASESMSFDFVVSAANAGFGYKYATVMDNAGHQQEIQNMFDVKLTLPNSGNSIIPCGNYSHIPNDGVSPFNYVGSNTDITSQLQFCFTPWTDVLTDLSGYVGQTVRATFRVRDCAGGGTGLTAGQYIDPQAGGHWAYSYIDTYCVPMTISSPEFCAGAGSIQICAPVGYQSYSWPAGQSGLSGSPTTRCVTITSPLAGTTYTVNMVSVNGCPTTATIKINNIPVTKTTDTTLCSPGGVNIPLKVTVSNPVSSPYTYNWSHGLGSSANVTVAPTLTTTYTVTVSNNSGCSSTETIKVTIQSCSGPTVLANASRICPGACATVTSTPSGGSSPYTYSWSTNATTQNISPCPGSTTTYTVKITDSGGNTATTTATVIVDPAVNVTTTPSNINCNGSNNGSINANPISGTSPYTYLWSAPVQTASTATGLAQGNYTVTVTDNRGCTNTATASITQPSALTSGITSGTINCSGGTTTATVTAGGGTPVYTYNWSVPGQTAATASGLLQGNYTVTVTDNKGCIKTSSINISQPAALTSSVSTGTINCFGGNTTATVTGGGGTPAYTYNWSPSGQTTATATGLIPGSYTVTVTDSKGCTATSTSTITQPAVISANITTTNASCGSSNGSATVTANGGTGTLTYNWSIGGTALTISGLSASNYSVTVTDSKGCTIVTNGSVNNTSGGTTSASVLANINCNGGNNGSATATIAGGSPAYTYSWSNGASGVTTISGLTAGSYAVTITDATGCKSISTVSITEPIIVSATITAGTINCNGGTTTASVTGGGGTPAYTYLWSTSGQTTTAVSGLSQGTYIVTITDNKGCTATSTTSISEPSATTASISTGTINCFGGVTSATASGGGGTPAYSFLWSTSGQTTSIATGLTQGNYTVTVVDNKGCTATSTASVTQPAASTATIAPGTIDCFGGTTTATVTVGGGTPSYTYNWSTLGQTTATANGLLQGSYTVTVTDNKGCTTTSNVNITQPSALTSGISIGTINCFGGNTNATATGSGGSPAYTYNWNPSGQTTATATGLVQGGYTVTISDSKGCTNISTVNISQPTAITSGISAGTINCFGGTTSATATSGGGTPGYIYNWNNSQTTQTVTGLLQGVYTLTVTDSKGCTVSSTVAIISPPALSGHFTKGTASCIGCDCKEWLMITGTGGTSPYTYSWPDGYVNRYKNKLCPGTHLINIRDKNGCNVNISVTAP